jgi:hypothetical protein
MEGMPTSGTPPGRNIQRLTFGKQSEQLPPDAPIQQPRHVSKSDIPRDILHLFIAFHRQKRIVNGSKCKSAMIWILRQSATMVNKYAKREEAISLRGVVWPHR